MKTSLKPYPAYRNSGEPWLGPVPQHWTIRSMGSVTRPLNQRGSPDLPLLSVVRERGVLLRSSMTDDENRNYIPDDLSNYKVVRKGNLVINKMKAWQGSMGIASQDGVVSPAYFVYDFKIANLNFGHALLRSKPYVALFGRASDGVRLGQWDLCPSGMKRIPVLIPPLAEQIAVSRYMGYMEKQIRRHINAKKKLLALLNEQRQAIIHRAVTRGLDPNVRLRPSGLEGLGDVPEDWEVRRLKNVCRFGYGDSLPDNLRVQGHIAVYGSNGKIGTHDRANTRAPCLVIGRKGSFGKVSFSAEPVFAVDTAFFVDERYTGADLRWLYYVLGWSRLDSISRDSAVPGLDRGEAYTQRVLYCSRYEQAQIAGWLDQQLVSIDTAVSGANRAIDLLREHRARLIADVVTGKIDVRELAASLEEESAGNDEMDEELDSGQMLADDEPEVTEETADGDD